MITKDTKGKWAKGNGGGPGYPLGRRRVDLCATMLKTVTHNNVQEITKRLVGMACGEVMDVNGSVRPVDDADSIRAMAVLLKYVTPPQEKTLNVSGDVNVRHDIRPAAAAMLKDEAARRHATEFRDRMRQIADSN